MTKNYTIDLLEFPANSPEELIKSTDFYSNVFGWNFTQYGPAYSDTKDSGVSAGLNATEAHQTAPLAVIFADDLDATFEKVKKSGAKIILEIYDFPGGRRFHFTDPASNELAVWGE